MCNLHQEYNCLLSQHVAAAKGFDDIAQFLIGKGASVNVKGKSLVIWHYKISFLVQKENSSYVNIHSDSFGNTPLLEALRNGHDAVTSLLTNAGASLLLDNAGNCLCDAVASKELEFLRRLLHSGVNANSRNYDLRTPLHIAASEGLYPASVILLEAGANVLSVDRLDVTSVIL